MPDECKLPVSWLAGNQGEYATSTEVNKIESFVILNVKTEADFPSTLTCSLFIVYSKALWALRDFMLQEALGVVKITAL